MKKIEGNKINKTYLIKNAPLLYFRCLLCKKTKQLKFCLENRHCYEYLLFSYKAATDFVVSSAPTNVHAARVCCI